MFDDVDEAIYLTVRDYRDGTQRGAVALAPRVNMNAGTLSNKANPGMESHQLTLRESIPIQLQARDFRILAAYSMTLNHVAVPLGDYSGVSDVELLGLYAQLHKEIGETAAAIHQALAQGRITREAVEEVRREGFEDFRAFFELLHRLEALADA